MRTAALRVPVLVLVPQRVPCEVGRRARRHEERAGAHVQRKEVSMDADADGLRYIRTTAR